MNDLAAFTSSNFVNLTNSEIVINIVVALLVGMLLSLVYKATHHGLSYSRSFMQTIVFLTLIVAIVIMVIGNSLARAFALVGALSIIRFRTVLKDTRDMAFVFGALVLGMAIGTSNYFIAAVGTTTISITAFLMHFTKFGAIYKRGFIIRFRCDKTTAKERYIEVLTKACKTVHLLSIEPSGDDQNLMLAYDVEMTRNRSPDTLIERLKDIQGISDLSLITSKNDVDY